MLPLLILLLSDNLKSVCLRVWIFIYKSSKNWSNVTNFEYVFEANNLRSSTKKFDRVLDTFYKITSKFFEFLFSRYFWMSAPISMYFFFSFCFCWKGLIFLVILILIVLPFEILKLVFLSVWTFTWAKYQVKIDQLSQKLYTFLK